MSEITRILSAIEEGEPAAAAEQLLPLVYDELRKLAAAKLSHEQPGQTLQATALVHEAYLRLVGGRAGQDSQHGADSGLPPMVVGGWRGKAHFFAAAAEAMRRILVDNARRKASVKHGGHLKRKPLGEHECEPTGDHDDLLALNEALDKLAATDAMAADLVKLRYFAGLTTEQAAELLGISARSAYYAWSYARSWLHREMKAD